MDAFYASVELRRRPELRGKPVVVCGSGPRAVVTTASYEARKLAGIHSAMPAAVARRRLPDAVYLTPDFPAYREASGQVMDVLRRNVEVVEVVGLGRGLSGPDRALLAEGDDAAGRGRDQRGYRPHLLGRHLREPDAGQDHQRAGQAGRAGRPLARGGAGAVRRPLPRPRPRDRPENGRAAGRDGDPHARGPAAVGAAGAGRRASAPAPAPGCTPAATSSTRRRSSPSTRPSRSRPRSPSTTTSTSAHELERHLAELSEELCRRLRKRELRGPHDRDQDPARRLDQRHPLPHRRGADQRPGGRRPGRPRAAARLRPAAAGAPARRPPRLLRADEAAAEPEPTPGQLQLGLAS